MVDLEKKYSIHKVPDNFSSLIVDSETFFLNVETGLDELKKIDKACHRQLFFNHIIQKIVSISSHISDIIRSDLLKKDEEHLEKIISLVQNTKGMSKEILEVVDSNNYLECAKLFDFITEEFINNYMLICSKRLAIKYSRKGIGFVDNRYEDTNDLIDPFFKKHIEELKKNKQLKKI